MINEETLSRMIEEAARRDERAACAELVRAAGCLCHLIPRTCHTAGVRYRWAWDPREKRLKLPRKAHDSRCPQALAAAIEARGVA